MLAEPVFGIVELDRQNFSTRFQFKAEVVSRSHCTVVTHSIFDKAFPEDGLCRLKCPILNFNGSQINSIQGYFHTMAHFNGHNCPVSVYIADDDCEPVIGHDLLTHLGIIVDLSSQSMHKTKSSAGTCMQSKEQTKSNTQSSAHMANLQSGSSNASMSEAQKMQTACATSCSKTNSQINPEFNQQCSQAASEPRIKGH